MERVFRNNWALVGFHKVVPPETNPGFFYNTPHNSVYCYLLDTSYHKNHPISVIFVCLTQLCILPWSHVDCRTLCIWAIWTAVRCTWERWEWRWCILYWVMSSCGRKGLRLSLWPGQSGNIFLSSLFKSFLMFDVFLDINGALALHRNLLFFFFFFKTLWPLSPLVSIWFSYWTSICSHCVIIHFSSVWFDSWARCLAQASSETGSCVAACCLDSNT